MNPLVPAGAPALSVDNLSVGFRTRGGFAQAVSDVSFEVGPGETLGVLGESGSGKTAILRAMMGLHPARTKIAGKVRVEGRELALGPGREESASRSRVLSMVYQEPMSALDPVYRIGDQIAETIVCNEGTSRAAADKRAIELLDLVSIPAPAARARSYPHEMSGGMRQRAMIALALATRPRVLLADEPTTALDLTVQIQILILLRRLQREQGMAIVFVTHDIGVATEMSDNVITMYAGRVVERGAARSVLGEHLHPYTDGLLRSNAGRGARGRKLQAIPGQPPSLGELPAGCSFAPRCDRAFAACHSSTPAEIHVGAAHSVSCLKYAAA